MVHNGIIENHLALRRELEAAGHVFDSETDTEIFAHLVADALDESGGDLTEAVRAARARVKGTYALVVMHADHPDEIVVAKNASPLVLGRGEGAWHVASDVPALLPWTREVIFLEEGEIATVRRDGARIIRFDGTPVSRETTRIDWSPVMAEKNGHKHFMHKEIHEQPRAIADTLRTRMRPERGEVVLDEVKLSRADAEAISRVVIVACGTSWHAGLVGKFLVEQLARVPVEVDYASEFRYRQPIIDERTLVLAISQSGETADTLAAMREAKRPRRQDLRHRQRLGLGHRPGGRRRPLHPRRPRDRRRLHQGVHHPARRPLPGGAAPRAAPGDGGRRPGPGRTSRPCAAVPRQVEHLLEDEAHIAELARDVASARDFLFLGRGIDFPIALEGALKLKEISYLHAEGYPAGEMKHGPIALIDQELPVVVVATRHSAYEKVLGNLEEARARGGRVIAIATEGDAEIAAAGPRRALDPRGRRRSPSPCWRWCPCSCSPTTSPTTTAPTWTSPETSPRASPSSERADRRLARVGRPPGARDPGGEGEDRHRGADQRAARLRRGALPRPAARPGCASASTPCSGARTWSWCAPPRWPTSGWSATPGGTGSAGRSWPPRWWSATSRCRWRSR